MKFIVFVLVMSKTNWKIADNKYKYIHNMVPSKLNYLSHDATKFDEFRTKRFTFLLLNLLNI